MRQLLEMCKTGIPAGQELLSSCPSAMLGIFSKVEGWADKVLKIGRPLTEGLFDFRGKRGRLSYLLVHLSVTIVFALAFALLSGFSNTLSVGSGMFVVLSAVGLIATWISLSTTAQRLRDLGFSAWCLIAIVIFWSIPFLGLLVFVILVALPGNERDEVAGLSP